MGVAAAVTNIASTAVAALTVAARTPRCPSRRLSSRRRQEPASATAARLSAGPALTLAEQVAPQAMPAGVEVTVPAPAPDFETVTG